MEGLLDSGERLRYQHSGTMKYLLMAFISLPVLISSATFSMGSRGDVSKEDYKLLMNFKTTIEKDLNIVGRLQLSSKDIVRLMRNDSFGYFNFSNDLMAQLTDSEIVSYVTFYSNTAFHCFAYASIVESIPSYCEDIIDEIDEGYYYNKDIVKTKEQLQAFLKHVRGLDSEMARITRELKRAKYWQGSAYQDHVASINELYFSSSNGNDLRDK